MVDIEQCVVGSDGLDALAFSREKEGGDGVVASVDDLLLHHGEVLMS